MGFTGGVVFGQIFSLQQIFGTANLWHFALSFQLLFLVIFTLPYYMFPESPKYLYLFRDRTGVLRELRKLCDDMDMAQEELTNMEIAFQSESEERNAKVGMMSVITDPKLFLPLLLVCAMQGEKILKFQKNDF